ncbi:hypothetical protein HZC09_02915 [Candidatus Micrarchaeota archaeon]|nr:hypothetical protein [Candidatus Micrarchaeota archaeon]
MVKIKSSRVNSVAAKRMQPNQLEGMGFNVNIRDVKAEKDVSIVYDYTIKYNPEVAEMIFVGELVLEASKEEIKAIQEEWKKKKQLPLNVASEVLTALSYTSGSVGTLLAYAIGLVAPISVQKVTLQPETLKKPEGQKAG